MALDVSGTISKKYIITGFPMLPGQISGTSNDKLTGTCTFGKTINDSTNYYPMMVGGKLDQDEEGATVFTGYSRKKATVDGSSVTWSKPSNVILVNTFSNSIKVRDNKFVYPVESDYFNSNLESKRQGELITCDRNFVVRINRIRLLGRLRYEDTDFSNSKYKSLISLYETPNTYVRFESSPRNRIKTYTPFYKDPNGRYEATDDKTLVAYVEYPSQTTGGDAIQYKGTVMFGLIDITNSEAGQLWIGEIKSDTYAAYSGNMGYLETGYCVILKSTSDYGVSPQLQLNPDVVFKAGSKFCFYAMFDVGGDALKCNGLEIDVKIIPCD